MAPITAYEEKQIDNGKHPLYRSHDIYFYGDIDFNKEEDIHHIKQTNLIMEKHGMLYSNIDYNKGTVTAINGQIKWAETTDPVLWLKQKHLMIGKPAKVVVYKGY